MIHVTTSSDNSDSVWVRNEWARFLSLISSGQKKILIPVYKGITPYELPNELQNLQGQDFSKLGIKGQTAFAQLASNVLTTNVHLK